MTDRPDNSYERRTSTPPRGSRAPALGEPANDFDSEPKRKWRPKAELLRALEDARRDLKPGEASLFWDWTRVRESAPDPEEMRPSGEGEVLVSDKDAAAAYVPPVECAPAIPSRMATKSRIRVREDVDPRRQPTVKTARASDPNASRRLAISGTAAARESRPSWSAGPPEAGGASAARESQPPASGPDRRSAPSFSEIDRLELPHSLDAAGAAQGPAPWQPTHAQERRRRIAWAIFFGTLTGTLVFFWLQFPRATGPRPAATSTAAAPAEAPASVAHGGVDAGTSPLAGPVGDRASNAGDRDPSGHGEPSHDPAHDRDPGATGSAGASTSSTSPGAARAPATPPANVGPGAASVANNPREPAASWAPLVPGAPPPAPPAASASPSATSPAARATHGGGPAADVARGASSAGAEPAANAPGGGGFLIRKKGSN